MKTKFFKRVLWLMIPLLTMFSTNMWADYTITFKTSGTTDLINTGGTYATSSETAYVNGTSSGVQFGSGSKGGNIVLTMTASGQVKASKITLNGYCKFASNGGNCKVTITFTDNSTENHTPTATTTATATDVTITNSTKTLKSIKLESTAKNKRFYVTGVTVVAAASCTTNPTVGAGSNSSVTSTTATVSCSSGISSLGSAGCSISSYGFVIGTSANPAIGGSGVTQHEVGTSYTTTGTSFSKDLTGLSASTTYYVCPYATNGNGTGYGTQTSFTTSAACTTSPTVTAGSNSSVTSSGARVTCSSGISSLGSAGCSITSYGFVLGTSANPTTSNTTYEVGTSYASTGTSFYKDITGLSASTTYYVRPYATNGNGTSYGTQTSFTTAAAPTITISQTSRAFGDRKVNGGPYEMTFTVSGANLTGNIGLAITGTNAGMFSINKTSLTPSTGTVATTEITVSYSPTAAGSHSATITLSSTGAANKTVSLSGTGKWEVTWNVSGETTTSLVANSTKPTLPDPAPSSCDATSTTFVGWTTSTWTGKTDDVSGYTIHEDNSTMSNVTSNGTVYNAVFAKATGGGTKWVLTGLNAVTAGTYAILNQDNHAFNGTVNASGHGDCTTETFSFTNGEATSAPTGTCEVTFTASSSGFTMYVDGSGYLYAKAASSGNLAYHNSESSYWLYNSSNWKYNSNSAFLRSYNNTTGGIRTYGANNGNGVIKLAKKTGGVTYSEYLVSCCDLKPVTSLAVSSMTANSVTLSWTAPSPTTGIDHLELRNASTDAKIGSNIAVGTTTTSVSGLVECNTYSYKIVSVGASCETSSEAIEAQPYSGAKTVTFNYNGGSGSPASFTTSCSGNTVSLPTPDTRAGYTFDGWWTAEFGGVKKGDAGASYTVSGTTTLWAHWSQTNYTVTMQQSPAAGATLSGGTTTAHYGNTINISTDVPSGYRFTGWTASPSVTFASSSSTSTSFTMPASNVTVTANFVQVHTLTFTVPTGGGSAVTPPATADHGGTVTLPNVTGYKAQYDCETFLGWTTTAPVGGTWASTPTYKAAGATSDAINSNTVFYAVYSRNGGGESGSATLTNADIVAKLYTTDGGRAYDDAEENITATDGSVWAVKCYAPNSSTCFIQIKDGTYYLKTPTMAGNITSVTLNYTAVSSDSRTIYFNTTASKTSAVTHTFDGTYTSGNHDVEVDVSSLSATSLYILANNTFKIQSATLTFGPPPVISHNVSCPDCDIDEFDLTYNANTANFPGSTTTCSGVTDYAWEDHDGKYTICSTAPTLSGYKFTGWNTQANGTGQDGYLYQPGEEVTCFPTATVTLYARYERVYTVTFDNQGATTPVTQGSYGAAIDVPAATTPCSGEWAFVGWSETAIAPMSLLPTLEITSGTSTYTPTADKTLYAIYRKTSTSSAFVAGMSGAYKISNGSTVYAGACNNSKLPETNAAGAYVFYIKYTSADGGKYTIQQSDGKYLKYTGSSTSLALDDETPYYWTMVKNGDLWRVQSETSGRYLQHDAGTGFKAYTGSGTDVAFIAADGQYYYRTMSCATDYDITFHANGSTINWAVGHLEASYKDLANATVVSTFPTATYSGWTFLGWRRSDYAESTTAPESATIFGGSNGTSGNSLTISSANEDLYPVFTRFEDNAPFDEINGGDYYIYYLAAGTNDGYGNAKRVYAATYDGEKRYNSTALCASATTFTFEKLANGKWTIYDNTTHKYLCDKADNWLCQQNDPAEWTITVASGNQFDAYSTHSDYHIIAYDYGGGASTAIFQNYYAGNLTTDPSQYHRVYLGSCTNRTFTTNPSTTPYITMNGEVAPITSSQNGAIRATNVLSVSGGNLTPSTGEITISSDNGDIYFSLSTDKNFARAAADQPKSSVTITANGSGVVTPTPVYIHYKPSSNTDTWTSVTVTASYPGAVSQTATIELRIVKENFVIAAKVAGSWYALPANMVAEGVFEPVLIDVDESSKVAYGPATVGYKMWPVQTINGGTDEYAANGDKVRFAGNSNAGLWASNSNNYIRNWATITAIGSTAETPASYEWIIETADRNAYTLKSMYSTNYLDLYRPTSGGHAGKLVWASNGDYVTNEVHFFPLEERATINIIPREWKTNGLVFAIAADNNISLTSGHTTAKIGTGDAASATITRHSTGGYGLYEVALPDLTSHYGKVLTLKMKISGVDTYATATIPIIVNANASTKTSEPFATLDGDAKNYDVVVLSGKTLTTNASASEACKFQNLYLYPGATLVNTANGNLSVSYLEMRGGIKGIDAKSSLEQDVPRLLLGKSMSSTAGANLDMYVNTAHSYALSVPFNVTLSNVNFANSLNTTTSAPINGALDAQFMIMEYDGAQRVSTGKGWKHITSTERTLHAGEGYVLQGKRPKGQPFAVIRFPFTGVNSWADNTNGEIEKGAITIYANNGGPTTPDNEKGWNLIANPYMATISYNTEDELVWAAAFKVGSLDETATEPWDGKYAWKDASHAYVTMPNDSYTAFPQTRASKATFYPFKNFFIQTTDADGAVTFVRSDRHEMPRYLMPQEEHTTPIYADINIAHGGESAQAGLTIDADATVGYKFGEDQNIFENREALDYLKMYTISDGHYLVGNTLTPAETAELIPLEFYAPSTEGEYIFSLDENSDIDRLEYVILYDAELGLNTNLLTDDYTVELDKSGLIENRFSLGLKIKEKDNSATGIDDVGGNPEQPYKFIYRDKMYILRGGKLYDATGKQMREIQ